MICEDCCDVEEDDCAGKDAHPGHTCKLSCTNKSQSLQKYRKHDPH